jgi:hypothetical protein
LPGVVTVASALTARMSESIFNPITAAYKTLWAAACDSHAKDGIERAVILFAMRELGVAAHARFGGLPDHDWDISQPLADTGFDLLALLDRPVSQHRAEVARIAGVLQQTCVNSRESSPVPGFYHDPVLSQGWLSAKDTAYFILLNFDSRWFLVAHKSCCSLKWSDSRPIRQEQRIRDPYGQESDIRVRDPPDELSFWWDDYIGSF